MVLISGKWRHCVGSVPPAKQAVVVINGCEQRISRKAQRLGLTDK